MSSIAVLQIAFIVRLVGAGAGPANASVGMSLSEESLVTLEKFRLSHVRDLLGARLTTTATTSSSLSIRRMHGFLQVDRLGIRCTS
jgi:hypothetical protein